MIGVSKKTGQEPEIVLLRFPKEQYKYVATKPWHGSQKVLEENDDYVIIQLEVIHNYELEQKIGPRGIVRGGRMPLPNQRQ
jgi:hypothetical protein